MLFVKLVIRDAKTLRIWYAQCYNVAMKYLTMLIEFEILVSHAFIPPE